MKKRTNVKPATKRLINKIKANKKASTGEWNGMRLDINYRERDMRQESIDIGSHGAKEYFGDKK